MTLWTIARQASLSVGFSRQKYWSGLPFPPPGDLPNPGIEPTSSAPQAGSLLSDPQLHFISQHLLYLDEHAHTPIFFSLWKYRSTEIETVTQHDSVHSGPVRTTSSPKSNPDETLLML